jgi:O-antigen/teichoic acid export membrane protein
MILKHKVPLLNKFNILMNDPLYRNAAFILGITLVNSATGFLFWLIAARLYTPYEVGISTSTISIVQLLAGLASMGLGIGIVRFLAESDTPGTLINTSLLFTTVAGIVVSLVYLSGIRIWSPSLGVQVSKTGFSICIFLFVSAINLGNLFQWIFIAFRRAGFAFLQSVIMNFIRIALLIMLINHYWGITLSVMVGWWVAFLVSLILFLPRLLRIRIWPLFSRHAAYQLVPYSIGNYVADFFYLAPALIAPPLMLEKIGASSSGFTYIALMIGNFITSPGISLSKSAFAEASSDYDSKNLILRKTYFIGILITIPLSAFVFFFPGIILGFFGQTYVAEAENLLKLIAISAPLVVFLNAYFYNLKIVKRIPEYTLITFFIFVITIVLTLNLSSRFGISSIGISWVLSQSIAIIFIILKKYVQ